MPQFKKPAKRIKRPIKINKIIRSSVIQRDSGCCVLCGRKGESIHHCLYKSYGGNNTAQNLVVVCNDCHRRIHSNGKKYFPILLKLQQEHYPNLTKKDLKRR
jgi:5-methylcytosine-specific restriction endonuclease McrA